MGLSHSPQCDGSQSSTPSVNSKVHYCTKKETTVSTPFQLVSRKLLNELSEMSIRAAQCIDFNWNAKYSKGQSELRLFVQRPSTRPLGTNLPRPV